MKEHLYRLKGFILIPEQCLSVVAVSWHFFIITDMAGYHLEIKFHKEV